jgi:hypothetical protein
MIVDFENKDFMIDQSKFNLTIFKYLGVIFINAIMINGIIIYANYKKISLFKLESTQINYIY